MTPGQVSDMVARTKARAEALSGRKAETESDPPVVQSFEAPVVQNLLPIITPPEVNTVNVSCPGRDCQGRVVGESNSQGSVMCSSCGKEFTCRIGYVREAKSTGPEGQKHWRVRYYLADGETKEESNQEAILEFDFTGTSNQPDLRSKDLFVHLEQGGVCAGVYNGNVGQGWVNGAFDVPEPIPATGCGGCCGATALLLVCLPVAAYMFIRSIC